MKKIITTVAVFAFACTTAFTQKNKPEIIKKKVEPAKTTTPAPPPPPPSTPPPAPAPVYSLTSARVIIKTGADNKEFPSKVTVYLQSNNTPQFYIYMQTQLDNEMRINANTEFGLAKRAYGSTGPFPEWFTLESIQKQGLALKIYYAPNLFTDAWKIENVKLVLEFKDQNGNLHPTMGNKTIDFSNAYGFLNTINRSMECNADGALSPLTAVIK